MAVAHWLTQHAAQQRIHHHGCGMIPEIHSEDTPAATAAYRMVMNALVLVEAWRSSPDPSLGAPDQDGIQGISQEQFHTTAAHAAEECGHLGFVDVWGGRFAD